MQVIVNNKPMEAPEGGLLSELIKTLKLDPSVLVAELNGKIVPRGEFDACALSPGDRIELVRLVGGG